MTASPTSPSVAIPTPYDVLIVGGSVAGLSAALALGRSLRHVLVLDSGQPCNRFSLHSHNLFTRDGETPTQLLALARQQALAYPTVTMQAGLVTRLARTETGFVAETAQGQRFTAHKVLIATGVKDVLPPLEGLAECWGKSVLHCPYCHGYEVHGRLLGLLANGETASHRALLIRNWSRQLTLFTNGPATLTAAQRQQLAHRQVLLIETPISRLAHEAGQLRAVHLTDGRRIELAALFASIPFEQSTDLPQQLGCNLTKEGLLEVGEFGTTSVPGVYAAGDNSTLMRSLAIASARGQQAAAWLNHELIGEETALQTT